MQVSRVNQTCSPVLVTGATGKTGMCVIRELLRRGISTRAFIHRFDGRAEQLKSLGVDLVTGDFFKISDLRSAMIGMKGAYFCFPPADHLLEATVNFAIAAKEAGLEVVVNLSQFHACESHPSSLTRQHWLGERVLDWAEVGATHLRTSFFDEGYLIVAAHTIVTEGRFYLPYGTGRAAPVSCEDIGRVVSGIFETPSQHAGQVYKVTGPSLLSQEEVAAVFTAVLGRRVEYVDTPIENWRLMAERAGFSSFLTDHFSFAAEDYRRGCFELATSVVRDIVGQMPESFSDFVRKHRNLFGFSTQEETIASQTEPVAAPTS